MESTSIGKYRQTLGEDVLGLPGLQLLGHNISSKAALPLHTHTHEGAMEIVVVARGSESYFVDGQLYRLSGGDVFVSYVDQPHSNGGTIQGVSEIIWFQIDLRPVDLLGLSQSRADSLRSQLLALDSHLLKADRECLWLLKRSLAGFLKLDRASWQAASSLFVSALFRLLFLQRSQQADDAMISRAVRHIHQNLHTPLPLEELCGLCSVSLSGFKHKFKECTGETPRDFINHSKISRAKELLGLGKSVTETAMELGFNSSDYFAVVFKKYTTLTPSEYTETVKSK
jgi:AraC-like DNA-binding protein